MYLGRRLPITYSNNLALQKNEASELKKRIAKMKGRLRAKKEKQDPVPQAIIKDHDNKITTLIKEHKNVILLNCAEMNR